MTTPIHLPADGTGWEPPPDDELRGAVLLGDPHTGKQAWAYAEVGCGDHPTVSFRLPTTGEWVHMSADEAVRLGGLLARLGGAALAAASLETEAGHDDPRPNPAFASTMLKGFDPGETELPMRVIYDRLRNGRHPAVHGGVEKLLNANTRYGGIELTMTDGGEPGVSRCTLEAVVDG